MRSLVVALTTVGLASTIPLLWEARRALRSTTLSTAWMWGFLGALLWIASWLCTFVLVIPHRGLTDQLWYTVALLVLCAPIAVLGAKLPMARVWGWFVLAPLLLVLGWPALYAWRTGWPPARLVLQEPAVVAFGFVCLMGFGNYFGTKYALSSALIAGALLALVIPLSTPRPDVSSAADWLRIGASLAMTAAIWGPIIRRRMRVPSELRQVGLDAVWNDFRDYYGIVWARRIQDRFNVTVQQIPSHARLTPAGLRWETESAETDSSVRRDLDPDELRAMESTLRWLLRRFVSPEWINSRFEEIKPLSDSGQLGQENLCSRGETEKVPH